MLKDATLYEEDTTAVRKSDKAARIPNAKLGDLARRSHVRETAHTEVKLYETTAGKCTANIIYDEQS